MWCSLNGSQFSEHAANIHTYPMQQKGKKEALLAEDQNSKVQLLPKQGLEGEKTVL